MPRRTASIRRVLDEGRKAGLRLFEVARQELLGGELPGLSRRGYEGADQGRRTDGWLTSGSSANAEIQLAGPVLRQRARDLVRNNAHAASIIQVLTDNVVGEGIQGTCTHADLKRRELANTLWLRWITECDTAHDLTLASLQSMAVRSMLESGEVLIRRRPRRVQDALSVPLQLQLLEADFIDSTRNSSDNKGRVVQGVEFDPIDRRTGYWLWNRHPGDQYLNIGQSLLSNRVQSEDIVHLFRATRPGQVRGVTWLAPAMARLRDLHDYEDAELVRKRTEACFAAFVTPSPDAPTDGSEDGATPTVTDSDGNLVSTLQPGTISILRNGKDIRFNAPASIGGYQDYKKAILRDIASSCHMPYTLMTGDLSDVNYSSIRAGLIEFRRMVSSLQRQVVIPLFLDRIWGWFIDAAIAAGELPDDHYPVAWQPPRFEEVDRQTETAADLQELMSGTRSWQEIVRSKGRDPAQVLREIQESLASFEGAGIVADWDLRKRVMALPPAATPPMPGAA